MMRPAFRSLLALVLCVTACQTREAPVQPEKLASSSPTASSRAPAASEVAAASASAPSAAPTGSGGPLVPYAAGQGPAEADDDDIPSPDASPDAPPPPAKKKKKRKKRHDRAGASPPTKAVPGRVELVKAGAEPLQTRRFAPSTGQADRIDMTMTMAIGMKMGSQSVPKNALPPMVMKMSTKVTEVKPDGTIRYDFVLDGTAVKAPAGTDARVLKPLEDALGRLKGLNGYAIVSDRGISQEAKINLPKTVDQQTKQVMQGMEQAMNQISAPLPEEPIGPGAQWKYHTTVDQNGISLRQVATYDLKRIEGSTLHCDVQVVQTAAPQKVHAPGGVVVDLLGLDSRGTGSSAIRLDHLAPSNSTIKLSSAVKMGGPKGQQMQVDTDMTIAIVSP